MCVYFMSKCFFGLPQYFENVFVHGFDMLFLCCFCFVVAAFICMFCIFTTYSTSYCWFYELMGPRNVCMYTSTPPYVYMSWCLISNIGSSCYAPALPVTCFGPKKVAEGKYETSFINSSYRRWLLFLPRAIKRKCFQQIVAS